MFTSGETNGIYWTKNFLTKEIMQTGYYIASANDRREITLPFTLKKIIFSTLYMETNSAGAGNGYISRSKIINNNTLICEADFFASSTNPSNVPHRWILIGTF